MPKFELTHADFGQELGLIPLLMTLAADVVLIYKQVQQHEPELPSLVLVPGGIGRLDIIVHCLGLALGG